MSHGAEEAGVNARGGDAASNQANAVSRCPKCGTKMPISGPSDRCPVCRLRGALDPVTESEPGDHRVLTGLRPPEISPAALLGGGFDHYELLMGENGTPVELGRGAMGVTYKAFDTSLRCPVALKVINARYLDSESARRRFVREARSAARIRHPNVASVFHLGTKGREYFYAMEFVEGESLDRFIKRHGRFNVLLALDIAEQVAAALGAAQKEQIVHRDIKPANLMLNFAEERAVHVKVIDFGLARATAGAESDSAISEAGVFAGTPLFASPEQCAGDEVDTRSDIYSLGVTLWEMLTGKVPFSGTTAEVIRQHLGAPLPLDQLEQLPKPVVALLESMLQKEPGGRPADPWVLQSELKAVQRALRSPDKSRSLALTGTAKSRRGPPSLQKRWISIAAGAAILAAALVSGVHYWGSSSPPYSASVKSIAVLPFDNVSDNKENEYFSDGLTSEVIYELSKVADLLVIARSSVLRYKDTPVAHREPLNKIGEELGVGAILESTVQRAENRVKIVTILYDAHTGKRLWGASYDRGMNDLFAIQSDLAMQIAGALQARLSADQRATLRHQPTGSLTAYDLYLQGRSCSESHRQEDNDKAIELFKQSLEQDPKFVLAYIGLADAYVERVKRFHGADSWLDSAIDLCQQAIALDPKQLRAYTELAAAFNLKGWFDRMAGPVRIALELAPNDWDANRMAAAESTEFRREGEMYESIRKCFITNPYDSWAPYELALICWTVDEQELADQWMQRAIDLEPDPQRRRLMACERLVYQGDYAAALPEVRQLPPDLKTHYTAAADLALFCSMKVGDWPAVTRLAANKLKTEGDNPTGLLRLALAQHGSGQEAEARTTAVRAVASAQQKLSTAKSPRWMRFDLAVGSRLLNQLEDAYQHLHDLLANSGFPDPILGPMDPGMDLFKPDKEFQSILANLNRQNETKRARILKIEKSYRAESKSKSS
jgi:serine/threonine protein kinase/thioredoxin-like negative regulator of GroEL